MHVSPRLAALLAVAVTAVSAAPPGQPAAMPRELSSAAVLARLRAGGPLVFPPGTVIRGSLDLSRLGAVASSVRCEGCRVTGKLLAANVVFRRAVDFSGLRAGGAVDFRGATFDEPALFGVPDDGAHFASGADFSFARFRDLAGFEDVEFGGLAAFTLARFGSDAIFTGATFDGAADFTAAIFGGGAGFGGSSFGDAATFDHASFAGRSDFRQRGFEGPASFREAEFQQQAQFAVADFFQTATFARARFADGASFGGSTFEADKLGRPASFERASAQAKIDFDDAIFKRGTVFRNLSAPAVSFDGTTFGKGRSAVMRGLSTQDLVLPLRSVRHVMATDEVAVLELVESSAKARGELKLANDAHYRLQVLASRDDGWLRHAGDVIFYRGAAGYLVRPLRPLLLLLALAVVATLWREVRAPRPAPGRRTRLARFPTRLLDTLALVGRRRAERQAGEPLGLRLEVVAYRVLVVCALLGLASSNPTLRQMIDALL